MSKVSTLLTRFWVVGLFTLPAVAQVQTDKNACLKKYQKLKNGQSCLKKN